MRSEKENLWQIVWVLAKMDFKVRYKSSFLGFLWVILKPLSIFAILNLVFTSVFKNVHQYSMGMFTGIILWNFFSEGTMTGMISILMKSHIVKKIFIPRWIIVIASSINVLLNFIINLVVLAFFYIIYGITPGIPYILAGLYYCLLTYIVIITFSFITAPLLPRLRDLNQIWEVILVAGFYTAPIIYPMEIMPPHVQTLLYINPMTFIIVHIKSVLINQQFIFPLHDLIFTLLVIIGFTASFFIFKRTSRRVAEYL
jgi:ABC-2 type transport system permease protein